jgi:hypothetical protein
MMYSTLLLITAGSGNAMMLVLKFFGEFGADITVPVLEVACQC